LLSTETLQCDPEGLINPGLVQQFLVMQRANARIAIAHTKTRGEVAGSGRKLYKQKGTGNARVGDKKSPIRRKG
jgi:large subunit ribosomal protein L4